MQDLVPYEYRTSTTYSTRQFYEYCTSSNIPRGTYRVSVRYCTVYPIAGVGGGGCYNQVTSG